VGVKVDRSFFPVKWGWIILSLFSAFLLNLSFPYPGHSILAWISLVPLFIVLLTQNLKRTLLSALITGILFNVFYLNWMKEYKHPASLPGGVLVVLLSFVFASMLCWFLIRLPGPRKRWFVSVILGAAGWLAVDYLKTIGYLAFPWGILAYSQYRILPLIQSASVLGVWGIDFVLLFFNMTVAAVLVEIRFFKGMRKNRVNIAVCGLLLLLLVAYGLWELREERREVFRTARVAMVQANFDPWSPQLDENLEVEMDLTRRALRHDPDLVVWSESSVPIPYEYYLARGERHAVKVHNFIRSVGRPFLFGSIEFDGVVQNDEYIGDFYNVALFYNRGRLEDVYRKIHLVPFGEWFPYGRIFPFVSRILEEAGAGDFTPGTEYVVFDTGMFSFSVLICFEDVFGNLTRGFMAGSPELLINVTNDAWTWSEKAEVQHFSISVFRTIETRRSLVRAANGGVTVCVNPYGRVIDSLPLFVTDFLVCDVPLQDGDKTTIYTRFGDFFPKGVWVFLIFCMLWSFVKKVIDRMKKKNNM